eukprot:GEMP01064454.1.p1 GENE.GEMP01064454.1~~GEMP01064454.1.p1  ORF type:complete len:341 (+),score=67.58 GEMP01064454.1:92-1114(+)
MIAFRGTRHLGITMFGAIYKFSAQPALSTSLLRCKSTWEMPKETKDAVEDALNEPCVRHFKPTRELIELSGRKTEKSRATQSATVDEKKPLDDISAEEWTLPQPVWTKEVRDQIKITHCACKGMADRVAYASIYVMRRSFDILSGFSYSTTMDTLDEKAVLKRIIFLETVAGVPPMMAAMVRHLQSLRLMKKDGGWIHTLLEEAENERMHLMIAMSLRKPGPFFRLAVLLTQFGFCNVYFLAYLISPRFCHRFVGYLEEEAVKTYTFILDRQKEGKLPMFDCLKAPQIGIQYYGLPEDAMISDVLECMRADESHHRDVNHTFADLEVTDKNPIKKPEEHK